MKLKYVLSVWTLFLVATALTVHHSTAHPLHGCPAVSQISTGKPCVSPSKGGGGGGGGECKGSLPP